MNLKITMVGDKETANALARLRGNLSGRMMLAAVKSGARILQVRMQQLLAPYKTRTVTRNLESSIHIGGELGAGGPGFSDIGGQVITADRVGVEVGTNLIYAAIQEFGGTIKAKNAPWLVFKTDDGEWHSVKSVQIPPKAYMRGAYLEKTPDVIREIDMALDVMIRDALK